MNTDDPRDDHDDSLGGTATTDRDDPYTLLPTLVAAAKFLYVVLSLVAIVFLTLVALTAVHFSPNAEADTIHTTPTTDAIYYLDASFSGCDTMTIPACVPRTETYMHALAALAGVPIQTDSLSGARSADFIDVFEDRLDWWGTHPSPSLSPQGAPKHVIIGLTNDVWRAADRHRIPDMVRHVSDTLRRVSPASILYVVDYPPVAGLAYTNSSHLIRDPEQYEADRAWYRDWAARLPNTVVIRGAWDGYHGSGIPHPAIGADYHPDSRTALLAALRMMEAVLQRLDQPVLPY